MEEDNEGRQGRTGMNIKAYPVLDIEDGIVSECGTIDIDIDAPHPLILNAMVERGYLCPGAQRLVKLEQDETNLLICEKETHEPLYAIECGSGEQE